MSSHDRLLAKKRMRRTGVLPSTELAKKNILKIRIFKSTEDNKDKNKHFEHFDFYNT
jgi:hypothetical protein